MENFSMNQPSITLVPAALVAPAYAASALRTDVRGIAARACVRAAWDVVDATAAVKRERTATGTGMGHLGFGTPIVPGTPAWSPPV